MDVVNKVWGFIWYNEKSAMAHIKLRLSASFVTSSRRGCINIHDKGIAT